jgi:cytochrome bd-type quinol oxidase subunit 2
VGYGLLYIFSQAEEKPLSFMLIFFACLFPLLIIIYSLWNYYNDLSQDKEDKFS